MDSRFLKSLIAVIDSGSIAEAARLEHLTAAAISQRIKALEIELNVELLCRNGPSAKATEACLRILPRARQIVAEVASLKADIQNAELASTLRLGLIPSQLSAGFLNKIDRLHQKFPFTRVSLSQNTSRLLYASLVKGELDAVIIEEPDFELPKTIKAFLLRREPLVLLSKEPPQGDLDDYLRSHRYIEYLPDPFIANIAEQYLSSKQLQLKSSCDTGSLQAIKMMVADGGGVSLVPRWQDLDELGDDCVMTTIPDINLARNIVLLVAKSYGKPDLFEQLHLLLRTEQTQAEPTQPERCTMQVRLAVA